MRRRITRILVVAVLGVGLVAAACGTDETDDSIFSEVFVIPTPAPENLPTEEDLRDRFEGLTTEPYDLLIGTCFNQYTYLDRNDLPAQVTTAVGCNRPHNAQVYAVVIHDAPPGAPYPGEEAVDTWGQSQCYQQFEPFVGLAYELSQLEIGMITPNRADWMGDNNLRRISCYVFSYERLLLVGTMAGIAL